MNRWVLAIALFLIGSAGACRPTPPPMEVPAAELSPADTAHADILARVRHYYADLSARDWAAYAEDFWPGATIHTLWDADGSGSANPFVVTVPEFIRRAPEGPGSQPIFEERLLAAEVRLTGNLAQVWARYEARFGDSTAVDTWTGVDAFTLLEHQGVWRIASLAYVPDLPR